MFTVTNHLLDQAEFLESPNSSERTKGIKPNLIVIHNISLPPNNFGGDYIVDFFLNKLNSSEHPFFEEIKDLKVSSHLFINRTGKVIQFVDFNKKAWHAGISKFEGKDDCNDFSIGIELEGTDTEPYSDEQYQSLTSVTKCLMNIYPKITKDRIVGHADIAPKRKTDPGESFDWSRYRSSFS